MLPAKSRSREEDLTTRLDGLQERFPLWLTGPPNHDELQALVSGLAGVGLLGSALVRVASAGVAPYMKDGVWREGLIVNPVVPGNIA
jgi:hypothetical protein